MSDRSIVGDRDREIVAEQLGRGPRGELVVAARCAYGLPAAIRTSPTLENGTPFPTLYYLVCPVAIREAGRLEAAGRMREYEQRLADDPALRAEYERAHQRYVSERDRLGVLPERVSAGGMPERVKCLHALYAHELGDANPIGQLVRKEIEPIDCPRPCVEMRDDGAAVRSTGHPGFGKKKRRR